MISHQVLPAHYHQTTNFQWAVLNEVFPYSVSFLYCISEEIREAYIEAVESRKFLRVEIRGNQENLRTYICVGWEQEEEPPRIIACAMRSPWQDIVEDYVRIRKNNSAFAWGSLFVMGILIFSWSIHAKPLTHLSLLVSLGSSAIMWYSMHKIRKEIGVLKELYNKTVYHSPFYQCEKRRRL